MKAFEQVYQGDIWVMRLPEDFKAEVGAPIPALGGKLILQEGEMTGHHHHFDLASEVMERTPNLKKDTEARFSDEYLNQILLDATIKAPKARMFKGEKVARALVEKKILLREDLVVGYLEIENNPMKVLHQEHSSITLPPGKYVVGRQIESVAGEERRVAD